jgi:DNA sulfur modification protein DndD
MLIQSITLTNLGVYRGRHEIELRAEGQAAPVTLVGALNGSGKTTILEAIQIALYGEYAELSRRGRAGYQAYLARLLNRHAPEREGASVQLDIETDEGDHLSIVRTWGRARKRIQETLEVRRDGVADAGLTGRWAEEVERLIPQRLCQLFLFDGEQIEALADPAQTAQVLRTAVSALLGVDLIDVASRDLIALERRIPDGAADPKLIAKKNELESELSKVESSISDLNAKSPAALTLVTGLEREAAEIESRFEAEGGQLFERAIELEGARTELGSTTRQLEEELRHLASGSIPLAIVQSQLQDLRVAAYEDREGTRASISEDELIRFQSDVMKAFEIHGDSSKELLGELFAVERQRLAVLAKHAGQSGLSEVDYQLLSGAAGRLDRGRTRAVDLLRRLELLSTEKLALDDQLAAVPDESRIADLYRRRGEVAAKLEHARASYAEINDARLSFEADVEELNTHLDRVGMDLAASEETDEKYGNRLQSSRRARGVLKELQERVVSRHLEEIRLQTLQCYTRLLRKGALVRDLAIDPESMALTLLGSEGEKIPAERLSAGERQLLATAVLWALGILSGQTMPVIIDTPLGRLDSSHRTNLVMEYFPNASHQVILLSTDEEVVGGYHEMLSPKIGLELTLHYDEAAKTSCVSTGYFLEVAA